MVLPQARDHRNKSAKRGAAAHCSGRRCEPSGPREARPDDKLREAIQDVSRESFRRDAQRRTMVRNCAPENLEIPGLVLAHHPGMTVWIASSPTPLAMTKRREPQATLP
jgi:hypothetical protein